MMHDDSSDPSALGDQPMSASQAAYLKALSAEAGEPYDGTISSAEASKRIARLQQKTHRKPEVILADEQTDG